VCDVFFIRPLPDEGRVGSGAIDIRQIRVMVEFCRFAQCSNRRFLDFVRESAVGARGMQRFSPTDGEFKTRGIAAISGREPTLHRHINNQSHSINETSSHRLASSQRHRMESNSCPRHSWACHPRKRNKNTGTISFVLNNSETKCRRVPHLLSSHLVVFFGKNSRHLLGG
jgi:hypothetical protein